MNIGSKEVTVGLSAIAIGVSLGVATKATKDAETVAHALMAHPRYQQALVYERLAGELDTASFELHYFPPQRIRHEHFPNPQKTRETIEAVLTELGDNETNDDQLRAILPTLPVSTSITLYEGQEVTDDTFASQRKGIKQVMDNLEQQKEMEIAQGPDELIDRMENAGEEIILFGYFGTVVPLMIGTMKWLSGKGAYTR